MNPTALILALLLLAPAAFPAGGERVLAAWEFNRDGDLEGWQPNAQLADVRVAGGQLSVRAVGDDPILELQPRLDLAVTPWQVIEIRLRADRDGTGELFWASTDQGRYGGFSQERTLRFPVRGDGSLRTYRLRPFWQRDGRLVRLRFDVYDGARFELDSLRILEPPMPAFRETPEFDFSRGTEGWQGLEGAELKGGAGGAVFRVGAAEGAGWLLAPPLGFDAGSRSLAALRLAVDRGRRATLFFATSASAGLHTLSFPVVPDGREHTYNVDLLASAAWSGRIVALGLRPGDDPAAAGSLRWFRVGDVLQGDAELEIAMLELESARPRIGQATELVAAIRNRGGLAASNVVGEFRLRAGADRPEQVGRFTNETLAAGGELRWRWPLTPDQVGTWTAGLKVSAAGTEVVLREARGEVLPASTAAKAGVVPEPRPVRGPFEVGVYYFPGWRTANAWTPIRDYPERRPLLGWYREGDPEVADWHIKWAVEHGITFFAYDWYWSRGARQLEHALHDGYFRARHRALLKFCLLWANHNAPGSSSFEDCLAVTRHWIEHYFHRPEHLRIDGRPVMILFSPDRLTADLGEDGVRRAFTAMREECVRAGLPGLYLVACVPDAGAARRCAQEGYDAVTAYNWPHLGVPAGELYAPFATLLEGYRANWNHLADTAGVPLLPPVCGGWDSRPWHGENQLVRHDRTPALFRQHLADAREFVNARLRAGGTNAAAVRPVLLVEAWNEFGEGSYVEPHREYGFGYLDAIRDALVPDGGRPHEDLVPGDVGLGPYDVKFPEMGPPVWEFARDDQGWNNVMDLTEVRVVDGVLVAISTGRDPALLSPAIQVPAADFRHVRIRMRLSAASADGATGGSDDDAAQLFWRTATLPESEASSLRFPVRVDGAWHNYEVPVGRSSRWRGQVTRLRLDPGNRSGVRVELDSVRATRD